MNASPLILGALFLMTLGAASGGLPSAPKLVLKPAGQMAWRMAIQPEQERKAAPNPAAVPSPEPKIVALDFISSNGLTKVLVHPDQGPERECWKSGQWVLCRAAASGQVLVLSNDYPRFPYAAVGFYGVENVKSEHFQGSVEWEKVPCLYFRGTRQPGPLEKPQLPGDGPPGPIAYEAWFDAKNGLPVAYKAEGKIFLFTFSTAPPEALFLPPEWQAALDKFNRDLKRAGLAP